jgi:hypothetical protein
MHTRKEIRSLTAEELLSLRRAMAELQRRSGPMSFIDLAGFHGIPRRNCPHGSPFFLPWHRAYIRMFESALQSIDPNVALPFWDWTSSASIAEGMAAAHTVATFTDGGVQPNPLASGPIEDRSRRTRRVPPHRPDQLRSFAASVSLAMARDNYLDFNDWLEGPHGSIHVWVGGPQGDMASVPRAAYDPIFWSHHSTIDRQWAIWQKCNPSRTPPTELLSRPLPGLAGWAVTDTLDLASPRLDYTYEDLEHVACPVSSRPDPGGIVPFGALTDSVRNHEPRMMVEVRDVDRGGESFMVDLFVRDPSAPTREAFAGSFGILGAEGLHNSHHGHHQGQKTTQRIDITEAVDGLGLRGQQLEVRLSATNKFGESVEPGSLPIGALDLRIVP